MPAKLADKIGEQLTTHLRAIADEFNRFPKGAGFPGKQSADWGWVQHILASLSDNGRAAVVLDTGTGEIVTSGP